VFQQNASQHREVDLAAMQVGTKSSAAVTRFQHDVDNRTQRFEQIEKQIQEYRFGRGSHQHGNIHTARFFAIAIVPKALARHDFESIGGANRVSQFKPPVSSDGHVSPKFLLRERLESSRNTE